MHLPPALTTVTPLSKILAMILFITLPFVGFWLGREYQKQYISRTIAQDDPTSPSLSDTWQHRITASPIPSPAPWKPYRNKRYRFAFQHPQDWRVDEHGTSPFVQLQHINNGTVESIVGGITILEKAPLTNDDARYLTMYASRSTCPTIAGEISGGGTTNVYCLTGKELRTTDGVWKGAVECSAASFYGFNENPQNCPHQFWMDTKDFFYIVHFNFFEPIREQSEEEALFDRFLSTFRFVEENNSQEQFCQKYGGTWLEEFSECENFQSTTRASVCSEAGGVYSECASPCRHMPPDALCTGVCHQVCAFSETDSDDYCVSNNQCRCAEFTGAAFTGRFLPGACDTTQQRCKTCFYL